MKESLERKPEISEEDRESGTRPIAEVVDIASRMELNGEPNTEGMKICAYCENPIQYQWTSGKRTKIYCSNYCRSKAVETEGQSR